MFHALFDLINLDDASAQVSSKYCNVPLQGMVGPTVSVQAMQKPNVKGM